MLDRLWRAAAQRNWSQTGDFVNIRFHVRILLIKEFTKYIKHTMDQFDTSYLSLHSTGFAKYKATPRVKSQESGVCFHGKSLRRKTVL